MERDQIERCLEQVKAYQASGLKAHVWAEANGVPLRSLSSWCAHARRWQARLDGVPTSAPAPKVSGFVAAHLPAAITSTVRIEMQAGSAHVELHWPVGNTHELAAWLREVGR